MIKRRRISAEGRVEKVFREMQGLKRKMEQGLCVRNDRFSVRRLQLEVSQKAVLACCALMPLLCGEMMEVCLRHLQGVVLEQLKAEKRCVRQQLRETVIVELEEWDMMGGLFACEALMMRQLVMLLTMKESPAALCATCVSLCRFAMAAAGEKHDAYDFVWIVEMLEAAC